MRKLMWIVILAGLWLLVGSDVRAAKHCGACEGGSPGIRACWYDCECTSPDTDLWGCPPYEEDCPNDTWETCSGSQLSTCSDGYHACSYNGNPGSCCPDVVEPTLAPGAPTKKPADPSCVPSCPALGSYCGTVPDGCDGNCLCNECLATCLPACGQPKNCGGFCETTDAGIPADPATSSPGSLSAPYPIVGGPMVTLNWTASLLADYFQYEVYDLTDLVTPEDSGSPVLTTVTTSPLVPGTKRWRVRAVNSTCAIETSGWSGWRYFVVDTAPGVSTVTVTTGTGTTIPWESTPLGAGVTGAGVTGPGAGLGAGVRANICDPLLLGSAAPLTVRFSVAVSDDNGSRDIAAVAMIWDGNVYPMSLGATGAFVNATASVTIPFTAADFATSVNPVSISIRDAAGVGSTEVTNYSWKVWDCMVDVSGNIYDDTDGNAQCLTGTGFSNLASDVNFQSVDFDRLSPPPAGTTTFNATNENTYSSGNLMWGVTYQFETNSDLDAVVTQYRWIDMSVGTTSCGQVQSLNTAKVDPYQANPSLRVDASAIKNQEPWFQVSGGGVGAVDGIADMVPTTCFQSALCVPAITKELGVGESNNGLVASGGNIDNNSGCSLGGGANDCKYGTPNNWRINQPVLSTGEKLTYQNFFDKYFVLLGEGRTMPDGATMSSLGAGATGVVMVKGNFVIDTDNTLPAGGFLMIVAQGNVTINQNVDEVNGIIVADGSILAGGTSNSRLDINGLLYASGASGSVRLNRGYTVKSVNNTAPSVVVNYDPNLLFNMPGKLQQLLQGWKQY